MNGVRNHIKIQLFLGLRGSPLRHGIPATKDHLRKNVLGGPAVQEEQEKLAPGQASIQMGGDSWKKRLGEECRKLVYERYGEEEVYEAWKNRELNQMGSSLKSY